MYIQFLLKGLILNLARYIVIFFKFSFSERLGQLIIVLCSISDPICLFVLNALIFLIRLIEAFNQLDLLLSKYWRTYHIVMASMLCLSENLRNLTLGVYILRVGVRALLLVLLYFRWLPANTQLVPGQRGSESVSRRWTQFEMNTLLIHLFEQWPLWSYRDIAARLRFICRESNVPRFFELSAEECENRLRMLYAQSPERFSSWLPPSLFDLSPVVHTSEASEIDLISRLQTTLCKECTALKLGQTHVEASIDVYDFWSGPSPKGHPSNQSIGSLKKSSDSCYCCKFMYNAIRYIESATLGRSEADNMQIRLRFTRANGEHFLEIGTEDTFARTRMVHLDDWLPFRFWHGDSTLGTIARLVPEVPDLDYIAERIRCWQTECELRHPSCAKSNDTQGPLPPRVLSIMKRDAQIIVRLQDSAGYRGRYIALSYVWGRKGQLCFTSESEPGLRAGVNPTIFAKTIREAIELTYALGYCYLWVDALCIKQDSPSDWNAQSALMSQIYGNAGLTIMAARSTGVENGFLEPTTPCAVYCGAAKFEGSLKPVFLTHSKLRPHLPPDPLDLRAWTLQEEHLSLRKVKFTSRQMEWHCQSQRFEEQEREQSPDSSFLPTKLPYFASNGTQEWMRIVENYTTRQITFKSDRLPALSGLARLYAEQTGCKYLAGLWSGPGLIELLLWLRMFNGSEGLGTTVQQPPYLAPTWSWLCVDAPVAFKNLRGLTRDHKHIALELNSSVTPTTMDPFGQTTNGHLDLSAPAIRTTMEIIIDMIEYDHSTPLDNHSEFLQKRFTEHIMEPISVRWGRPDFYLDQSNFDKGLQVYCVILGHEWWGKEDYGMYGILVTPISLRNRTFRRVGMFECLPKFRFGDEGLDMKEVIAKRVERARKDYELRLKYEREFTSCLCSENARDAVIRLKRSALVMEMESIERELERKAQAIRADVEIFDFRIF